MKVSSIKRIVVLSLAIVFLIFSFQHNSLFVYADEDQRVDEDQDTDDKQDKDDIIGMIVDKSIGYLLTSHNEDGSYDGSYPYNVTAEICFILDDHAEGSIDSSICWIKEYIVDNAEVLNADALDKETIDTEILDISTINTDALARYIRATGDEKLMGKLITRQNSDGGFGITDEYLSDVHDSLLVLEALNRVKDTRFAETAEKLIDYLCWNITDNGAFSYVKGGTENLILTAKALYDMAEYKEIYSDKSKDLSTVIRMAAAYISECYCDKNDSGLTEEKLYMALALQRCGEDYGLNELVSLLDELQLENGSFYDDDHITALVVWLLSEKNGNSEKTDYDDHIEDTETEADDNSEQTETESVDYTEDTKNDTDESTEDTEADTDDKSEDESETGIDSEENSEFDSDTENDTTTEQDYDSEKNLTTTDTTVSADEKTVTEIITDGSTDNSETDVQTELKEDKTEDPKTSDEYNSSSVWILVLSGIAVGVMLILKKKSEKIEK